MVWHHHDHVFDNPDDFLRADRRMERSAAGVGAARVLPCFRTARQHLGDCGSLSHVPSATNPPNPATSFDQRYPSPFTLPPPHYSGSWHLIGVCGIYPFRGCSSAYRVRRRLLRRRIWPEVSRKAPRECGRCRCSQAPSFWVSC